MNSARIDYRAESVLDLVGNTPLVRLSTIAADLPDAVELYAKLEYFNPGGSVKDRAARQIILDALERGDLGGGKVLIDSTSGNTGVAYAMIGAALDVPVTLVMPANVSQARKDIIAAYGAEIVFSDPLEGSDGAIRLAKQMVSDDREGRFYYPDQYANPSNPLAHTLTTGPEIIRDTAGRVTHFVGGLGTTGTVMGTGRALKSFNPDIEVIAVEPDGAFHGLEGLKHLDSSIVPPIHSRDGYDRTIGVSTEEGWDAAEALARDEGLAVGYSSGAAFAAARKLAATLEEGVVVMIFCDHADRYVARPRCPR